MTRYEKLGVLAVRWLGVVFLSLAVTVLLVGLVGPWTMGGMMGGGQTMGGAQMMSEGWGHMARGGVGLWWAPTALFLVVGFVLIAMGRPLGSMLGSGLGD